jgi:hypothetical protein
MIRIFRFEWMWMFFNVFGLWAATRTHDTGDSPICRIFVGFNSAFLTLSATDLNSLHILEVPDTLPHHFGAQFSPIPKALLMP